MTRLRYKFINGVMVSTPVLANRDLVTVVIDPSLYKYTIKADNCVIGTGVGKGMPHVQKLVKEHLTRLGTVFQPEMRNRLTLAEAQREACEHRD